MKEWIVVLLVCLLMLGTTGLVCAQEEAEEPELSLSPSIAVDLVEDLDAETTALTLTPALAIELDPFSFGLEFAKDILDNEDDGTLTATPGITLGRVSVTQAYDLTASKFGDLTVTLDLAPLTLEYLNETDDAQGAVTLSFEKSW